MDKYSRLRKWLVIGIILLFVGASTTLGVSASCINGQLPRVVQQNIQAIKQDIIGQPCLVGNTLISNNTGNDYHPRMTINGLGQPIVVYEQQINYSIDVSHRQVPVVYSADDGHTWIEQFLFNSSSGVLQYPDIVYNAPHDVLYLSTIDLNSDPYFMVMYFIPGDIANAENALGYKTGANWDYIYSACACTNNYFLFLTTAVPEIQWLELAWFTYPDFKNPPNTGGGNYDGGSLHQSAPAAELEMDSNVNQLFIVCETQLDTRTQITIKTNVMDEKLITSGETQNNMEKYVDPEQMPGEYLGFGTDPDVSGSGNKVCVVYVEDGNVICKSSTTSAVYDPGFNWQVSTVDSNASAPAVYMQGDNVYCAYVKDGNLYLKISEDGGVTWGAVEQKNDVNGTVVAEKGAVGICRGGIAFTDTRNGNYDIYYTSFVAAPTPIIVIDSISGGFSVTAVIKNIGDAPTENFPWSITLTGTILIGIGEEHGTVSLPPGTSLTIKRFMVGFGTITVTVTADTATKTKDFKLFLIYFKEV
jgi:hypothetical protein